MSVYKLPIKLQNNDNLKVLDKEVVFDSDTGYVKSFVVHWGDDTSNLYVWSDDYPEEWYEQLATVGKVGGGGATGGIATGILGLMKSPRLGILGARTGAAAGALLAFLTTVQPKQSGYYDFKTKVLFYSQHIHASEIDEI